MNRTNGLNPDEKQEVFEFLESLANSTYINFQNIKHSPNTDKLLKRLKIKPSNYIYTIHNLTKDLGVRTVSNLEFIRSTQTLTEYGICYITNNLLTVNLSTYMLLENKLPEEDTFFKKKIVHDVKFGNFFDGDITYSFIGFVSPITMFIHSPYEAMNIARSMGWAKEAYEFEAFSTEIITTKQFRSDTSIEQRGCRFQSESNLTHYKVYSKFLCLSECRLELVYKHCSCIPHFYPNNSNKVIFLKS